MATTYDEAVINREAGRLYDRARWAMVLYAVIGLLVGMGANMALHLGEMLPGIGTVLGFLVGHSSAERWRLEAQRLLVMAAIERNTRRE